MSFEREIKLRFGSPEEARAAIRALGATPLRARRLQDDRLVDWPDRRLGRERCTLRVRDEDGAVRLTFKGPPQASVMKVREELETTVGDSSLTLTLLARLGLEVWFRSQKYREEYSRPGVVIAIDETPMGTFVELEGDEAGIVETAQTLDRTPDDYVTDSYGGLFRRELETRGLPFTDMVFETS